MKAFPGRLGHAWGGAARRRTPIGARPQSGRAHGGNQGVPPCGTPIKQETLT